MKRIMGSEPGRDEAQEERRSIAALRRACVLMLLLVAVFAVLSSAISRYTIARHDRLSETVLRHTLQFVQADRIALAISRMVESDDAERREFFRNEAAARIDRLRAALDEDTRKPAGTGPLAILPEIGAAPAALWEGLRTRLASFLYLANRTVSGIDGPTAPNPAELRRLVSEEILPALIRDSERAHLQESRDLHAAERLGYLVGGPLILLILAIFVFRLRPLSATADRQFVRQRDLLRRLQYSLQHDPLTGLPNRACLSEHLERLWAEPRPEGERLAVCHLDLSRFKAINDNHGHAIGDTVLRRVADILRSETRKGDFIARIGGDEFVVVIPRIRGEVEAVSMLDRIVSQIGEPFRIGGITVRIGARVGIATSQQGEDNAEALLIGAELATMQAKRSGEPRSFFSEEMRVQEITRNRLREQLVTAVDTAQIVPHFQPQIDLRDSRIVGFEALARWNHPEHGLIGPGRFLDLAEEAGVIDRVGRRIFRQSLDALQRWRAAGYDVPTIGINVSGREIRDPRFIDWLKFEVELRGLEPSSVVIELLETILVESEDDVLIAHLRTLSDHGFRIDLDDFGTGHASLSNLLRMKIDRIKIDRSFITGIERMARQRRLTSTMISMARSLEIEVLAEGVESPQEIATVRELGCHLVQGYAVARPMDASRVLDWLAARDQSDVDALSA